jgi:hypothetical protein
MRDYRREFAGVLADALDSELADWFTSAAAAPGRDDLIEAIFRATQTWSFSDNPDWYRNEAGRDLTGEALLHEEGQLRPVLGVTVRPPLRELNDFEQAMVERQTAHAVWRPEDGPPPPGYPMIRLLYQGVWWVRGDKTSVLISDMERVHCLKVMALLRGTAQYLRIQDESGAESGTDPHDLVDPDKCRDWVMTTPLCRALQARSEEIPVDD